MANILPPPEKINLEGDNATIAIRWERWKRSLNIFLDATEIRHAERKRATLLLLGGTELQEIIHNLPGAYLDPAEGIDVFDIAIEKLDGYFLPKQNKIYERHIFRQIKQEENEKFEKFVVRLRNQASKCRFISPEEHLIDQIVEKCSSTDLRKRILTMGDTSTLDKILIEANTLEAVSYQLEEYSQTKNSASNNSNINMVRQDSSSTKSKTGKMTRNTLTNRDDSTKKCDRCGYNEHLPNQNCPARRMKCHGCGKMGHFKIKCRINRRRENSQDTRGRNKRSKEDEIHFINSGNTEETHYSYVFNLNDDDTIDCNLGGVKLKLLIDSGCKLNLITDQTWEKLKLGGIIVSNQRKGTNKALIPYGSKQPLVVKGTFQTTFETNGRECEADVFVIHNGSRDLLGKETAMALGVLKLGIGVNSVEQTIKSLGKQNQTCKAFPKFKNVLVEIPVDETCKPVSQPYRRIPIPIEQKVEQKIKELLDNDIIEEVHEPSQWISPVVPILKDNDDLRLCVDMRRVNLAILKENHPLPCMDNLLPKIKKAKYFSKLDIKNAFHQVEIHPNSRYLTTFITAKGLYRYKRLMFGITCAPELFQKILERMLTGLEGVMNFIDDILIHGEDEQQHDNRLANVLRTLKDNRVLLNEKKCVYKVQKIDFLGHELTKHGIKPLKKYITSITEFRVPKTVEELQSFLGLVNYINKWLPNLSTMTEPLKKLLRKKVSKKANIENLWKDEQNEAFRSLKQALSTIKTLGYYDTNDETQVIADASPVGLGAVLIQCDTKGPRIIAYGNRTLTEIERKYSQTEKEALALVWSVEHFSIFLFGKIFDLVTDHKPLEFLFGPKSKPCARVERWVLRLQTYRFKIIYKPGKTNIADSLSRLCTHAGLSSGDSRDYVHYVVDQACPCAIPIQEIIKGSKEDQEIKKVKKGIYNNDWEDSIKGFKMFESELCFYDDILLRGNRIVIPKQLRKKVLEAAHEGHPGIVAMKSRLRSKVWWPRIDKDTEAMVKSCRGCTLVGLPNPPVPMKRRELPEAPWLDVAADLLGPLPNNTYLLVIIDYYSRYKEIKFTNSITSSQIIKLLKEIFSRLGYPTSITLDNERQFNGEVERQNRDILKRLKIGQIQKKDLNECIWEYLMMYNTTPHSVTGKTPAELFFRRQNRDKIPSLSYREHGPDDSEVRDKDVVHKKKGKEYGDKRRKAEEREITEGDKVYIKDFEKKDKLTANFKQTPHIVEKREGGDILIRNEESGQELRRNVIHLKKVEGEWKVREPDDRSEENE